MIDAGADVFDLVRVLRAERFGNLAPTVLNAVAEADRVDAAVVDRRPGVHRHRIGVIEKARAPRKLGDLANIPTELQDRADRTLAVHDAAGADRVADTLIDPIFQRNADVVGEGFKTADANAIDDIARAFQRLPTIGGGGDPGRQAADRHDPFENPPDHRQIVLIDVGQREFHALEFRHAENVFDERAGKSHASGADDGYLGEYGHDRSPRRGGGFVDHAANSGKTALDTSKKMTFDRLRV